MTENKISLPKETVDAILTLRLVTSEHAVNERGTDVVLLGVYVLADAYSENVEHAEKLQKRVDFLESILLNLREDLIELRRTRSDDISSLITAIGDAVPDEKNVFNCHQISIVWDEKACTFCAVCESLGLAVESDSMDGLMQEIRAAVSDVAP